MKRPYSLFLAFTVLAGQLALAAPPKESEALAQSCERKAQSNRQKIRSCEKELQLLREHPSRNAQFSKSPSREQTLRLLLVSYREREAKWSRMAQQHRHLTPEAGTQEVGQSASRNR